jgi:hypothetical protein
VRLKFNPNPNPTFNDVYMNSRKEAATQVYTGFRIYRYGYEIIKMKHARLK